MRRGLPKETVGERKGQVSLREEWAKVGDASFNWQSDPGKKPQRGASVSDWLVGMSETVLIVSMT